jgi:hypothetical protein
MKFHHKGTKPQRDSAASEDDSLDSIFDPWNVKIDDQTKTFPCQSQVRKNLRLEYRKERFDRLHLDDELVVD